MNSQPRNSLLVLPILLAACTAQPPPPSTSSTPSAEPGTATSASTPTADAAESDSDLLARGEYLTRIAGCNDCHTPGYAESGGELPKSEWLMGSPVGWHGPWGTTYPVNLRIKLQDMDEASWLDYSGKLHARPPMPDFAVRAMNEHDRLAIYRFIKSLGPGGNPAPAYLPPDKHPPAPYVDWVLPPPPPQAPATG